MGYDTQNIRSHKDLIVWQKALDFVENVYRFTSAFPDTEKFGLVSQMRRAAVSIPSNIAEGRSRGSRKDFAQFLHMALGSVSELDTQLEITRRLKFIEKEAYNETSSLLQELSKMLKKMIVSLKARS